MSKVNMWKCDQCGSKHDENYECDRFVLSIPSDIEAMEQLYDDDFEFDSTQCIIKFLQLRESLICKSNEVEVNEMGGSK